MTAIVALGAITGGTNLTITEAELRELGVVPGSHSILAGEEMELVRQKLETMRGSLPLPRVGGSVANTAEFIARAGLSCGLMGVGGDDGFGRAYLENCRRTKLEFLLPLEEGGVTGYDFYLDSEDGTRTILWTAGANSLLSPSRIHLAALEQATLLLFDGGVLDLGQQSEAAVSHCVQAAEAAGLPFVLTLASSRLVDRYRAFFERVAPRAAFVAGNLEQTAVLLGLNAPATRAEVSAKLAETSIDAVVTLDVDGALARFGNEEFYVPTETMEPVDSTGAGDNFLGAFIVARQQGLSVDQALAVGNAVASEIIRMQPARFPLDYDIRKLWKQAVCRACSPLIRRDRRQR